LNHEWFHDFFSGLAVDVWVSVAPPADADADFLQTQFGDPARGEILDVACGAGRHSIALAQRGYRVTGVDLSDDFLRRAQTAVVAATVAVELEHRDMRDLPWPGRFAGALCFGNSFGYMDRNESRKALLAIAGALMPGGVFVLETGIAAESILPSLVDRRWFEAGEILFLSTASYDVAKSRLDTTYTFIRGTERQSSQAQYWIFTTGELCMMFREAGLTVDGLYASVAGQPYKAAAPRLIIVARKSS
jgi:SAM-dependent methyltransferase